ncbi:cAMP-binding protein [Yeosuana aromativorans]|uniref:cAMP-binding protein n=1 Tax=Yeosuana aromativorans TaxID=288019 RepID=A0A8J3BEM9_9FLAO|nr:Crp/Fnr family transcriptional regulator [Yeosuana aromativorans]GGK15796.1 cAMP-binding protein [Yeosuana aromativorans]
MKSFKNILIDKIGLDEELYFALEKTLIRIKLKKKDFLIKEGETCSFIGFIKAGVLRSYILKDGNEFNIDFYLPDSLVSSYTSFLTQTPSVGNIQALSESEIYIINLSDYNKLLKLNTEYYKFGKYVSDVLFIRKCKREASLLMDSANDRYKFLLTLFPQIEQLVPQYHIASYLGIKPESLSRIKHLTYINEKVLLKK